MAGPDPAEGIRIQVAIDPLFTLAAQGTLQPWATAGLRILVHPVMMPASEMLQLLDRRWPNLETSGMSADVIPGTVPYLSLVAQLGGENTSPRATAQRALDAVQAIVLALLPMGGVT